MEQQLDRMARGELDRSGYLKDFYLSDGTDGPIGLKPMVDDLGDIDARAINSIEIGEGITLRVGRYGAYVERLPRDEQGQVIEGADPQRASVSDRKSTRLNSSHVASSYAVFCLKTTVTPSPKRQPCLSRRQQIARPRKIARHESNHTPCCTARSGKRRGVRGGALRSYASRRWLR